MAALGISLMSVSCGDKNDKESKEESKDADLESQMVGYWAPNVEAMEKEMLKEIGDNPNAAALAPMMTAMLAGMSVEIKKGEVTVHIMGQATTWDLQDHQGRRRYQDPHHERRGRRRYRRRDRHDRR